MLHDVEQRAALAGYERIPLQRAPEQTERLLDVTEARLAKAALVQRVAADEVFAERAGRPDAELRTALGFHAVSDGDHHIQAVDGDWFVGGSNVQILHIASRVQLSLAKHVRDVLGDDRAFPPE